MPRSDLEAVQAFNNAINERDIAALEALMAPDHRFVDSGGVTVSGRDECVGVWASFFESFLDYRNVFESMVVISPGEVLIDGRSVCSFGPLDGPARWRAEVTDGLVGEWRVEDPASQP